MGSINVDPNSNSLQVPQFQRNLLISPPGSPFEDWEQIEEDAPNQAVLASDLMHAAEISDYELDDDILDLEERSNMTVDLPITVPTNSTKSSAKSIAIVCSKGTKQPEHLPSINVQDWDDHVDNSENERDASNKLAMRTKLVPTAMPPMK
ncbi:MAG: Calcipressin [Benjaminiella poitrasii]|nr:MAG: Calcipressin [Benjaminiella poitrasii]